MWKAGSVCVNVGLGQRVPLTGDEGVPSAALTHAQCWQCFPKTIDNSEQEVALPAVTAQTPQWLSSTIAPHPLTLHMGVRLEWERKKRQNVYQGDCEHSRQVTHSIGSSPYFSQKTSRMFTCPELLLLLQLLEPSLM